MEKLGEDTIKISGENVPVIIGMLPNDKLKFYPENPRIYSITCVDGKQPTQEEVEERLLGMDHVKQLIQSITANGGLTDALIVRDGDFVVLEGNSRLAAYRELSRRDPIKWGNVKCCVLPEKIKDSLIFALLGQYHIVGKKDWAPYEQAGYLWRRKKHHNVTPEQMAKEMGVAEGEVKRLIKVYEFMATHNDTDVQHWSYYDEYLKSRSIKHAREEYKHFDTLVVKKIKTGEIPKAIDIRDKLDAIAAAKGKVLKGFASEARDFHEAYDQAIAKGVDNTIYKHLYRIRREISAPNYKNEIAAMIGEQKASCIFELKRINKQIEKLLEELKTE